MEAFLTILMVLAIYVAFPLAVACVLCGGCCARVKYRIWKRKRYEADLVGLAHSPEY